MSRARFEMLSEENARLRGELENERSERERAVDTMLANARLAPMHREPVAQVGEHKRIPKRTRLVDLARRLERAEAAPEEIS